MGFFSWLTDNTKRSIPSSYSDREPFPVVMIAPDGRMWQEDCYEGYGEFGGKDYYELLAEINGFGSDRIIGIDLNYDPQKHNRRVGDIIFPKLIEGKKEDVSEYTLKDLDFKTPNEDCPDQGFFYGDEDDDEDDYIISDEDDDEDDY